MKTSRSVQADIALVLITFIWGSTFTIVKKSLTLASPVLFVALRFWIAAAITGVFMPAELRRVSSKAFCRGLVLSVVLLGGFVLQTLGLRDTNPSHSAFITSLSVLLVPLLGFLIFRHRPRLQTLAGVILATIGLFLLLAHVAEFKASTGDLLTLVCAAMFAFHIIFLGRFVLVTDYRQLMFLQMAGAAVLCTLMIPVLEKPFITWNTSFSLAIFITGVLATAVAFYVQAWAQRFTGPNHAALIFSLEPFFATLFAYWILGQVLNLREWIGGMLVLAGILVSEIRWQRES
jgi:drug/metabolite transporter (DMT)-like permease